MTSIYTQRRLGLSHGLTLETLHCGVCTKDARCDPASFIAEGPLVCEDLCGVLGGEHWWREQMGFKLHKEIFSCHCTEDCTEQ